jgi:predicted permease
MLTRPLAYLKGLLRRDAIDAEVNEELRFHVEMETRANIERGMAPVEARRAALLDLGGVTQTKEAVREVRTIWLDSTWQDVKYAVRRLRREPGFATTAILTLALGIGANTAIFSVVDAALFRPLPYRNADRLVDIHVELTTRSGVHAWFNAPGAYAERLRAISHVFDGVETFNEPRSMALAAGWGASPLVGAIAPKLPQLLGVSPQLGRGFTREDVFAGNTIVISDEYWQRAFNRDPAVIGKTIAFSDRARVVIGVMPATFRYFVGSRADAWLAVGDRDADRVAARLRPGMTPVQAQREVGAVFGRAGRPRRFEILQAGSDRGTGGFGAVPTRTMLLTLLSAVGFVLVIACANVANLLLSRTLTRHREIAVRQALGASRFRLARQFLVEGLVLSGVGGVAATVLAWCVIHVLPALLTANLIRTLFGASLPVLDVRVIAFGVAAAIVTGVLCGTMPALRASRTVGVGGLLASGRQIAGASRGQRRLRNAFQAVQVALTLVLLAGAGLLVASFIRMFTMPRGFDEKNLGYASFDFPHYADAQQRAFFDQLTERMAALSSVRGATPGKSPVGGYLEKFLLEHSDGPQSVGVPAESFPVGADYFRVAGIALKEGRTFGPQDGPNAPSVAIISENAARRFWPGQSPIGRHFRLDRHDASFTVVGVVAHIKTIQGPRVGIEIYLPVEQFGWSPELLFRVSGNLAPAIAGIRAQVRAVDAKVTVTSIGMISQQFADFDPLGMPRMQAVLMGVFAAIALLTATVGLYGLLSYSVGQRTGEIGVRIALGADLSSVRWLVIRDGLGPVIVGLASGLVAALWFSRLLTAQLFQVKPYDPATFVTILVLFLGVSFVAVMVPMRRATRIDPAEALRTE